MLVVVVVACAFLLNSSVHMIGVMNSLLSIILVLIQSF